MPQQAIKLLPTPVIPIVDSAEVFPVGRIICIGRNYADHAIEMGHDPNRDPPFFFFKPANCATTAPDVPFPPQTNNLHHEVELIVALGKGGRNIDTAAAQGLILGYGVGLDLTRRDLQDEAKKLSRPWEMAKSFDFSAPVGALTLTSKIGHVESGSISLTINGAVRQQGDLRQMIWNVPEMIAALSQSFALRPGDLIMTGTPAGVGKLEIGDEVVARVDGLAELQVTIVAG